KQIEIGRDWFRKYLGLFPRIGYNVDSFGHTAALPDILAAHGQPNYVFMRPMAHETALPANVFRWRGRPGGKIVHAFRISAGYCSIFPPTLEMVEMSLAPLPAGVTHTMCFLGVGDHGGGPNEHTIQWVRDHRDAIPGARLEFSSPERFFRALQPELKHLPLVTGELQMHAIGCYTGHRPVKLGVRRAENMLALAQRALATAPPAARRAAQPVIDESWRTLCFNSFHDTLGGSCTPSAARPADDQLAGVKAAAETVLSETFRKQAHALPADPRQRIVLANYSGGKFSDFVEHEPWLEWTHWRPDWCLLDERNRLVPHQVIEPETPMPDTMRILFPAQIDAGAFHTLRIARNASGHAPALRGASPNFTLFTAPNGSGTLQPAAADVCEMPELKLIEEKSDTWSHNLDRF